VKTGSYISGAAHIGLIGWVLIGDVFSNDPPEPTVTDVSVISANEFDAMFADTAAPEIAVDLAMMAPAPNEDLLDDPVELTEDAAPLFEDPADTEAPAEETQPDVSGVQPMPDADVSLEVPTMALPSFETGPDIEIDNSDEPKAREAPRVAPIPTLRPETDVAVSNEVTQAAAEIEAPDVAEDAAEDAAPEEATTEIVTEAEQPAGAPTAVPMPRMRPQPTRTTQAPPQPAASSDALNDALSEALGVASEAPAAPPVPTGPPLSFAETEALRVAVSNCWNTGSLSSAALRVTVVVGVQMAETGQPVASSIRMISSDGGAGDAVTQAYEAARRAILRCGTKGYDLPVEKYGQWRDIEMTFNPEKMRIK
jgi:hypothetical protein